MQGEEFLRRLIESSQDCIKVLDLDGRLLSMNDGGRRLLEMDSVEPYIGTRWVDLWQGGHAERAAEAVAAAKRGEVARFEGFGPTVRGTHRWWETVLAPINGPDGRPEQLLAVSRDVTDRVAADRAKDEFLATLSHELRNPLAAILNGVAALDAIGSQEPPARNVREIIRRQTQHMAALLDDLLDVARIGEGKIVLQHELVDVATVVRAAADGEMPRIARKRQQLQVDAPPEAVQVRGDPVRLRQVVANLLNNASKYTPNDGRVHVQLAREGDEAVLRVRDDGIGIPPERLDDVFQLFTQVARTEGRTEGGLGIGLTLVRRLTMLHGGDVVAESAGPGQGSCFTVRLPIADGLEAHPPHARVIASLPR